MLKHIALDIIKADLYDFYQDILGGTFTRQFKLNAMDSQNIFNIDKSVEIHYVMVNQVEFELFVHEKTSITSFNHVCLQQPNATAIYEKANKKKYYTYVRKSKMGETYFIRDRNQNLFEIKPLINN